MAIKDTVENAISGNKVAIFSKSYCPYCKSAKATLRDYVAEADIKILELDELEEGPAIQEYLRERTGQSTVPNVFINTLHVGGNDSVQAARAKGQLQQLLAAKA